MPKPRHLPPTEAELAEVAASGQRRSSSTHRSRLTKKRSGDLGGAGAGDSPTDTEKKKSKVAAIRSKFSLKDLAREFRRDNSSPPPAVPALRKSSSSGIPDGGPRTPRLLSSASPVEQTPPTFEEERLYVPKKRNGSTGEPLSAPAATSSFAESLGEDRASQSSLYSSPPGSTPATARAERFRHALVHDESNEGLTLRQKDTDNHLRALLLDGSSPPAHTGELHNASHPEVVTSGKRICSLKAEEGPATPVKAIEAIVPPADIAREYSPSIYDNESVATSVPNPAPGEQKKPATDQRQYPLIVSSDQKGKKKATQPAPPRPAFVPSRPSHAQYGMPQQQSFVYQLDSQISVDETRYFTGMTSHGGYAPPPPHPGYQNTATLEQQLATHVNSLHHHFDNALRKLSHNMENNTNWSTDQVIRHVETVTDMTRMLNSRTVNQGEMIRELHQSVEYLRVQVSEMQHVAFRMEDKLVACFQAERAQVRAEIRNMASRTPYNTTGGGSSSHGESQGARVSVTKGAKEAYDKRASSRKKARATTAPKSEGTDRRPEDGKRGEHNSQEGECVASAGEPGKRAEQRQQTFVSACGDRGNQSERSDGNLHSHPSASASTSTFLTSSTHNTEDPNTVLDREIRRALKDPSQESSGSPEQKASRPDSITLPPLLSPDPEVPKMVFGFSRSDKDKKKKADKKADKKDTQSPVKEPKSDAMDNKADPKDTVTDSKDNGATESKPKTGEPSTETAEAKTSTEKLNSEAKSDSAEVKSTPKDKKNKKSMFNFKRHRDASTGFLRTPQRNKHNKGVIVDVVKEPTVSQPIPVPNPRPSVPYYDIYCPLPSSPEGIANLNSTEVDPAFVHPALRTQQQKMVLAERERLRLEGLARQVEEQGQGQQNPGQTGTSASQEQHQGGTQQPIQAYGPNSSLLPHHTPGSPFRGIPGPPGPPPTGPLPAPPVTFRNTSGRQQQSAPLTHPQTLSFGQAPPAIVSHYYGNSPFSSNLTTNSVTGAPNVLMPPRSRPGMPFPTEAGIDMRRWYHETRGYTASDAEGEGDHDRERSASQGNAPSGQSDQGGQN